MEEFGDRGKYTKRVLNTQMIITHLAESNPPPTTREKIYDQLREQIPNLTRRECTVRVMEATGVLLDQLLQIQYDEACEILENEANNE